MTSLLGLCDRAPTTGDEKKLRTEQTVVPIRLKEGFAFRVDQHQVHLGEVMINLASVIPVNALVELVIMIGMQMRNCKKSTTVFSARSCSEFLIKRENGVSQSVVNTGLINRSVVQNCTKLFRRHSTKRK